MHKSMIPQEVMEEYNLHQFLDEADYTYVEITGAIYGLAQTGYLENKQIFLS